MRFTADAVRADFNAPDGAAAKAAAALGPMPEWNLADLYPSPTAPEIARDLQKAAEEAKRLKDKYHGKLFLPNHFAFSA